MEWKQNAFLDASMSVLNASHSLSIAYVGYSIYVSQKIRRRIGPYALEL